MGTLNGIRVLELAGLGPAPMAGMMLADMGAEVIRIERPRAWNPLRDKDISSRGKKSILIDLGRPQAVKIFLDLVETADVVIDPYRPGVCERLGIGPNECTARKADIVFARMTGWGQEGPLSQTAGHDINYIAITGALYAIGRRGDKPVPPLNLVGDFGGGGMLLIVGILAALYERTRSGQGQVIDASIVDGTAQLMFMQYGFSELGEWDEKQREANMLDGGAHFYNTYECADENYVCVGSIEPQFYTELLRKMEISDSDISDQHDKGTWLQQKSLFEEIFKTRTRDEWCEIMEGTDVCFAPVLTHIEALSYQHNVSRGTYIDVDGMKQPSPAPRFSRTPSKVEHGPVDIGTHTESILLNLGVDDEEILDMKKLGIIQ